MTHRRSSDWRGELHHHGDMNNYKQEKSKDDGRTNTEELLQEPLIIALVCGFVVLALIILIMAICICRRKKPSVREPARTCQCFHTVTQDMTGHIHNPPPAYSPPEMYYRPPVHRCSYHSNVDMLRHHSVERLAPVGGNLNEFPLLQHSQRSVINPIYDGEEVDANSFNVPDGPLKDLYKKAERSFSQTISGKLLVSVARCVDHRGDKLILDNMGISLEVPEGAVRRGESQWITLVLNWDLSDNPQMTNDQSLVSPVVYVGPHGLRLEKSCVLSYRHCSFDTRQIQVMRSETELTDTKSWEALCNREDQSRDCYLTQDECRLNVDRFTLYTCVQSPLDNQRGKKWLQIAVFACPLRRDINHHEIRVYFLNKTPCALQWAIQNEAGFGGKLVCPEKVFLFDGGDYDMIAKTRYISDGWELADIENMDKLSFLSIWHGQCPHVSVCYKRRPLTQGQQTHNHRQRQRASPTPTVAIELSLHLQTYQRSLEDLGEKIFIQVAEDNVTPVTANELACRRHHVDNIEINVNNFSSLDLPNGPNHSEQNSTNLRYAGSSNRLEQPTGQGTSDTLRVNINNGPCPVDFLRLAKKTGPRILCHELRHKLVVLLDPVKQVSGNDWRAFAELLGLDACIPKLEALGNPTENLLNIVESRNMPLTELKNIFQEMNRGDCVKTLNEYLNVETMSEREPVESSYSGYTNQAGSGNISSQMSWDVNTAPSQNVRQSVWPVGQSSENDLSHSSVTNYPRSDENSYFARGRNPTNTNGSADQHDVGTSRESRSNNSYIKTRNRR